MKTENATVARAWHAEATFENGRKCRIDWLSVEPPHDDVLEWAFEKAADCGMLVSLALVETSTVRVQL